MVGRSAGNFPRVPSTSRGQLLRQRARAAAMENQSPMDWYHSQPLITRVWFTAALGVATWMTLIDGKVIAWLFLDWGLIIERFQVRPGAGGALARRARRWGARGARVHACVRAGV